MPFRRRQRVSRRDVDPTFHKPRHLAPGLDISELSHQTDTHITKWDYRIEAGRQSSLQHCHYKQTRQQGCFVGCNFRFSTQLRSSQCFALRNPKRTISPSQLLHCSKKPLFGHYSVQRHFFPCGNTKSRTSRILKTRHATWLDKHVIHTSTHNK